MPVAFGYKTLPCTLERKKLLSLIAGLSASSPDIADVLRSEQGNREVLSASWPLPREAPSRGVSLITEIPNDNPSFSGSREPGLCRACFDSGLISAAIFLLAMLVYDVAWKAKGELNSWLTLWGAVLFCVEALVDIGWSFQARHLRLEVVDLRTTLQSSLIPSDVRGIDPAMPPAASDRQPCESLRHACANNTGFVVQHPLDRVDWDLWVAVFFFLPSICAIFASLADPNIASFGSDSLVYIWNWLSTILYVVDGILALCGRWRERVQLGKDAPPFCGHWRKLDYIAWGDLMFLVGALCDVYDQVHDSRIVALVSDVLWTFDAVLYLIGSYFFVHTCANNLRNHRELL